MSFELRLDTAPDYLRRNGVLSGDASVQTTSLGGGVSNCIVKVVRDDDCFVAKQPLANLAVEDDWPVDVSRVHNEATAARAYATILDEGVQGTQGCLPCAPRTAKITSSPSSALSER